MGWNRDSGDHEARAPPALNLDDHWFAAFRDISVHCGLIAEHLEYQYGKMLKSRDDPRKDEPVFEVPGARFGISKHIRSPVSIQIHHEPGKLFKIKVVIIDYGGEEVYLVGNTSARHFYDEGLGPEETDDGKKFPDRRRGEDCQLLLRCDPSQSPSVTPCCDLFRRCIKKRDLLCKWEQAILDNDPRRKAREEAKDGGFADPGLSAGAFDSTGFDSTGSENGGFGGDAAADAGGGWGDAAPETVAAEPVVAG